MDLNLEGRVAVVTGGASGIGRAAAERLAGEGARIVIVDRDETALAGVAGFAAATFAQDVADRIATRQAIAAIEADLGPIAVLVTAAGILDSPRPPERMTDDAWSRILATNLDGTRIWCQAAGTLMAERGAGAIVTVASITGLSPGPLPIYGPAKAAVIALSQALAGAWGRKGVRVNAVAPGHVRTPALERGIATGFVDAETLAASTAMGRLALEQEVAAAVCFLASDAASAITGITLPVDCGQLLAGGWAPHGGFDRAHARTERGAR